MDIQPDPEHHFAHGVVDCGFASALRTSAPRQSVWLHSSPTRRSAAIRSRQKNMVTLKIFTNSGEAAVIQSVLEAAGIPICLRGENTFQNDFGVEIVLRLQVPEGHFEEAARVLKDFEQQTGISNHQRQNERRD